jgi:hypothetical protein
MLVGVDEYQFAWLERHLGFWPLGDIAAWSVRFSLRGKIGRAVRLSARPRLTHNGSRGVAKYVRVAKHILH